jgi:hypothetical protein
MMLAEVHRFRIPIDVVQQTEHVLRSVGESGFEAFLLWSGTQDGSHFNVRTVHVPLQNTYKLEGGLCVHIDADELHALNAWLFRAKEVLAVQVHAHPGEAYHSDTDSAYPIVTTLGGLSIVAADFCRQSLFSVDTAIYRLQLDGWIKQSIHLIEVV